MRNKGIIYLGTATSSYTYYFKVLFISKLYAIVFFTSMQNTGILGTFRERFGNKKRIMVYIPMEKNRRYVQMVFKTSLSDVRKANRKIVLDSNERPIIHSEEALRRSLGAYSSQPLTERG